MLRIHHFHLHHFHLRHFHLHHFHLRHWTLAAGLLGLTAHAYADNWPQYRRDERRTGFSSDTLRLPLSDLWTFGSPSVPTSPMPWGRNPGSPAGWRGRVYVNGMRGHTWARAVCLNLRTGRLLWAESLRQRSVGSSSTPTVLPSGEVAVADWAALPGSLSLSGPAAAVGVMNGNFAFGQIRLHDGVTGRLLAATAGAPLELFPALWLTLRDNPLPDESRPGSAWPSQVGSPLLVGRELIATRVGGPVLTRCLPGQRPEYLCINHGPAGAGTPQSLEAGGSPPVLTAAGIGLTWTAVPSFGARTSGVAMVVAPGGVPRWHIDLPFGLSTPCAAGDLMYVGAGDESGLRGVVALDAASGAMRWRYAPGGLPAADPRSSALSGSNRFPELCLDRERVYAGLNGALVALSQQTGAPAWVRPLPPGIQVVSLAGSREALFVVLTGGGLANQPLLAAFRLSDGVEIWRQTIPRTGALTIVDGLLLLDDGDIHVFAPGERSYRLAADSAVSEDYDPAPVGAAREDGAAEAARGGEETAEARRPDLRALADATVVRLGWPESPVGAVELLRARRKLTGKLPMLAVVDALDPTRSRWRAAARGGGQHAGVVPRPEEFVPICRAVAEAGQPEYLDLAPEVNIWLARFPGAGEEVAALVRAAAGAMKEVSPRTRVLVSLNAEALNGRYGRGPSRPFGLFRAQPGANEALEAVLEAVDAVGLTTEPRVGFADPVDYPADFLLDAAHLARNRPVLVTDIRAELADGSVLGLVRQLSALKHVLQACYWLDARIVAYPALRAPGPAGPTAGDSRDYALWAGSKTRSALAAWLEVFRWPEVRRLSTSPTPLSARER